MSKEAGFEREKMTFWECKVPQRLEHHYCLK